MRIWTGFGSEHSSNIVLIGHFADARTAAAVERKFVRLREAGERAVDHDEWDRYDDRLGQDLIDLMHEVGVYDLTRADMNQFGFEHSVSIEGNRLRISTEESDIQGFLKVLITAGAKVEVFSRHNWTESGDPLPTAPDSEPPAIPSEANTQTSGGEE